MPRKESVFLVSIDEKLNHFCNGLTDLFAFKINLCNDLNYNRIG